MCGIAGYIGPLDAEAVLLVALERLKYRGYDSAGMVVVGDGELRVRKAAGRLKNLELDLQQAPLGGSCGVAHTRWATHGPPTAVNAHPHLADDERVAVIHNGIIENHEALRQELTAAGAIFRSQTDTEVIPHLLTRAYAANGGDPVAALRTVAARLEGNYAIIAVFADQPDRIIAMRHGPPLLLGRGKDCVMLASDLPALLPHAQEYCQLADDGYADLTTTGIALTDAQGRAQELVMQPIRISLDQISKGEFDSFMAKEIAEQPAVLRRLLDSRCQRGRLIDPDLGLDLASISHVVFLAAGTSWHAAQLGKRFLEQHARVHVEVDISSEYRYRNPVAGGGTLVVCISQSGETADTLAGLRLARSKFIPVVSLVNTVDSTIARESDGVLPLLAGPEIGVASTKAYTAQVLALYLFSLQVARAKGRMEESEIAAALARAQTVPELVAATLTQCESAVIEACRLFSAAKATVFLGRGGEHATALEGALKVREIAYVHATGYAAGEFKHGPIAVVDRGLPVVALCPRDAMRGKMLSNIEEVRARAGRLIGVGAADDEELRDLVDVLLPVASCPEEALQPLLSILPLQRYAYHVARAKGCDVDQPRNLAKSVTVE